MAVSNTQIYAVINDYLQLHLFLYTFLQATFKSFVIISSAPDMQFIFSSVFSVSSLSAWILSLVFFSPFKKRWKIIIYFSYLFKCRPYLYTKRTICQHKIFGENASSWYFIFPCYNIANVLFTVNMCSVFRTLYCFYSSYNFLNNVL